MTTPNLPADVRAAVELVDDLTDSNIRSPHNTVLSDVLLTIRAALISQAEQIAKFPATYLALIEDHARLVRVEGTLLARAESAERELATAKAEVEALRQLVAVARCPECDGSGKVADPVTVPVCCGNFLPTGECCGNAQPGQDWTLRLCQWCDERNNHARAAELLAAKEAK